MSRLSRWCTLLAFLSTASAQAPSLDIAKILKDLSSRAADAKQYAFEGQIELAGQTGTEPGKVLGQAKVRFAVGQEGKYLLDLDTADKDPYMLISDGQKSWAYVPKLKQYTEEETGIVDTGSDEEQGASDTEHDLTETFAREVIPILSRMYKTGKQAGPAGDQEYLAGKKKMNGPAIRIVSKTDEKGGFTTTLLVLDPATQDLRRMVHTDVSYDKEAKTLIRVTVDFNRLQLGESLPDSAFSFTPPKNAKLVETVPIPGQTGSFLLNHAAPEFDMKTVDGQRMRLSELRGHPVLLDFWASWCGPCRRELPSISKIASEFQAKGLVVLGVNDEGKGKARDFAAKNDLAFPTLDDYELKMHRAYRVNAIPSVFLVDATGKVVRFMRGAHDYEALKASLKAAGL